MKLDSETLETAAKTLEARHGNQVYQQAWRKAAKIIRALKPKILIEEPQKLIAKSEQIISSSPRPVST